jgi:uridine kinase
VRVIESYLDLAARVLAAPARLGAVRLIAIDGPSGAGKSAFAERFAAALERALGRAVPVVPTDDLLDGWDDQFTFWTRLERDVLAPLRAGRPGRYRRYDWRRGAFGDETVEVPPAPVVIIEGVGAARAAARPELSLAVFVTAPSDLRLARALDRDGEGLRAYLEKWRRAEDRHFAADATADRADMVVDGAPDVAHDPYTQYVRAQTNGA